MADSTDNSLFREIDEELRQEHYNKLWKKYGNVIIGAAILLVVSVAGHQIWQNMRASQAQSDSVALATAINHVAAGNSAEANASLNKVIAESGSGYAMLARFQQAGLAADKGDAKQAAAIYFGIASDAGTEQAFQGLATILGVTQGLQAGTALSDLEARLVALVKDDNPWRFSARELSGLIALKEGKLDKARPIFENLSKDPLTPRGIRARATELVLVTGQ